MTRRSVLSLVLAPLAAAVAKVWPKNEIRFRDVTNNEEMVTIYDVYRDGRRETWIPMRMDMRDPEKIIWNVNGVEWEEPVTKSVQFPVVYANLSDRA